MRRPILRHRLGPVVCFEDRIVPAALALTLNPAQSSLTISGSTSLTGSAATNAAAAGSFADQNDGTARLTAPISVTFNDTFAGQPLIYTITGTMVGTAPFPTADLNGPAAGADTAVTYAAGG